MAKLYVYDSYEKRMLVYNNLNRKTTRCRTVMAER